jgi:hypothetical protein
MCVASIAYVCSIVDPVVEVKTFAAGFIYARPLQRGIAAQLLFKNSVRCLMDEPKANKAATPHA